MRTAKWAGMLCCSVFFALALFSIIKSDREAHEGLCVCACMCVCVGGGCACVCLPGVMSSMSWQVQPATGSDRLL